MINASLFLRRAFLLDTIASGMMAVLLTFGASELALLFNLPEQLLRETGLFLIAYTALVGWLATRQSRNARASVSTGAPASERSTSRPVNAGSSSAKPLPK